MPRHQALNHSDCYIECPDGGYAYYIEPYGPCQTGCDTGEFARSMSSQLRLRGWSLISSGVVRDISGQQLVSLARALRAIPEASRDVSDLLNDLERVGADRGSALIMADWNKDNIIGTLRTLRDAAKAR
jgi:hypothetical protein